MKHFRYFAFWGLLLIGLPLQGQTYSACTTPTPKHAPQFDGPMAENLLANPFVVQIFVHILRNDDGSNAAMSDADLKANLDRMAAFYRPHNICFTFLGRDFINNTTWNLNYTTAMIGDLHAVNPHTNAIDIYVHGDNFEGSGGNAYDIPSSKCSVAAPSSFNFEHEIGHCLGLLHTFETFSGTLVECPDGSNCGGAGDMVCDTPADFGGSENNSSGCSYTGNQTINCNGNDFGYNPPLTNIMSYWWFCYGNFTAGQAIRMQNTINTTAFLQDRLSPIDRVIAGVTLTDEITVGAQNSIQIGNVSALGNVAMNLDAHGIFNAGANIKIVPGAHIEPTGDNAILLTINQLCNGLFFTSNIPNESRQGIAQSIASTGTMAAFPNPFTDQIRIRVALDKPGPASLQLFDFAGRLLQTIDCQSLADTGIFEDQISIPELQAGLYFLRLQHEGGQQTAKLIKIE